METRTEPPPRRKYTVSPQVLAANRRNLARANAAPHEIRYRSTPRRTAAARQNLLKAGLARQAPSLPRRRPWSCHSVLHAVGRAGAAEIAWFRRLASEVASIIVGGTAPGGETGGELSFWSDTQNNPDKAEAKLARGMAEGLWRWTRLLRERADMERDGLLRVWRERRERPVDAVSAAWMGWRLLGAVRGRPWLAEAFARLELRLTRLARLWGDVFMMADFNLREEVDQTPAEALGNPFQPMPPGAIAERLRKPLPELPFGEITLPGLPAEPPLREVGATRRGAPTAPHESSPGSAELSSHSAAFGPWIEKAADLKNKSALLRSAGAAQRATPAWPITFRPYRRLVKRALAAPRELAPLVERIARLSWDHWRVIERESRRAQKALQLALDRCPCGMHATTLLEETLDALTGEESAPAALEAARLEEELARVFRKYLDRRYGAHPAFEAVGPPEDDGGPSNGGGGPIDTNVGGADAAPFAESAVSVPWVAHTCRGLACVRPRERARKSGWWTFLESRTHRNSRHVCTTRRLFRRRYPPIPLTRLAPLATLSPRRGRESTKQSAMGRLGPRAFPARAKFSHCSERSGDGILRPRFPGASQP